MTPALGERPMARKTGKTKAAQFEDERVTLLNLKGTPAERDLLAEVSRKTGVPLTTIARRGIAMWIASQAKMKAPEGWSVD